MDLNDLRETLWYCLEADRKMNLNMYSGAYSAFLHSINIDKKLNPLQKMVTLLHEFTHFCNWQMNWGEAIRRLDMLEIKISLSANELRGLIIAKLINEEANGNPSNKDFERIAYDNTIRRQIKEKLSEDEVFMSAIRTNVYIQARKKYLAQQMLPVDEGYAYWTGVDSLSYEPKENYWPEYSYLIRDNNNNIKPNAEELCKSLLNNIMYKLPEEIRKGFEKIDRLCSSYSSNSLLTNELIAICMSPKIDSIQILGLPLAKFKHQISTYPISPNSRLIKICAEVSSQRRKIGRLLCTKEMRNILSILPKINANEFNNYWYTNIDSNQMIIHLFNALNKELGVSEEYVPVQYPQRNCEGEKVPVDMPFFEDIDTPSLQEIPSVWLEDGGLDFNKINNNRKSLFTLMRQAIMTRDRLMSTMINEEII